MKGVTWPLVDTEMLETQAVAGTSEETTGPDIIGTVAIDMEADVLTAACELIAAEVR